MDIQKEVTWYKLMNAERKKSKTYQKVKHKAMLEYLLKLNYAVLGTCQHICFISNGNELNLSRRRNIYMLSDGIMTIMDFVQND